MTRRNWKSARATSLLDAFRLCKEYAQDKRQLSVARIADRMGSTEDSLYKWLAMGSMPAKLITAYEYACGCHFVTEWLATSADRLVVPMPKGHKVDPAELLDVNSHWAEAFKALTSFCAAPSEAAAEQTMEVLRVHLTQVHYHHANVAKFTTPELDFES